MTVRRLPWNRKREQEERCYNLLPMLEKYMVSGYAKLFVSLRATAKQSQGVAIASFHSVPLAMTNVQLILPKYLVGLDAGIE